MTTVPPTSPMKTAKKLGIRLADDQERSEFIAVCHIFELYKSIEDLVIPPKIQFKGAIANNYRYVDISDPQKQRFTLEYMWEILRGKLAMSVNMMYRIYYHVWRCKDASDANFIHPVMNPWALMNVRIRLVSFYACLDMAKRYKNVPPICELYKYWINYYLVYLRGKSIWCPIADIVRDLKLAAHIDKFTTPISSSNALDALRRKNGGNVAINQLSTPAELEEVVAMTTVHYKLEWLSMEQREELEVPAGTEEDPITDDDRSNPVWPENWVTTIELRQIERDIATWMKELYFEPIGGTSSGDCPEMGWELRKSHEYIDEALLDIIMTEKEREVGGKFVLTDEQKHAVRDCIIYKCNVLIGYPGTGKSTIVDIVTRYFYRMARIGNKSATSINSDKSKYHISLCALSGMATIGLLDKCPGVKHIDKMLCGTIDKLCHTVFPNLGPQLEMADDSPDIETYGGDIAVYDSPRELMDNFAAVDSLAKIKSDGKGMTVKIGPDLVIVDEFSMVDIFKFHDLLYFVRQFDSKLLLVGDYNQLPSIGPGSLLRDIVDQSSAMQNDVLCGHELRFHVNRLTHIKRQESGSHALVKAIKKMTTGVIGKSDLDTSSFRFLEYDIYGKQNAEIATDVAGLVSTLHLTSENSKFICPQNSGVMGAVSLNNALQEVYNPYGQPVFTFGNKGRGGRRRGGLSNSTSLEFRLGDLVVRVENDYSKSDTDVYVNGDRGRLVLAPGISALDMAKDQHLDVNNYMEFGADGNDKNNYNIGNLATSREVNGGGETSHKGKDGEPKRIYQIVYDDGKTELITNWELYQSFRLAYALTIHKAQGSQFENVVVVMTYDQRYMWTTPECESYNLLYTAISRGVKRCVMIGRISMLMKARQRVPLERFSSLF